MIESRITEVLSELERCKRDPIYFAETYLVVNGIVLGDYERSFLKRYYSYEYKRKKIKASV